MKTTLIAGVNCRDGAYLPELLLAKGHDVHGIMRCASFSDTQRVEHLYMGVHEQVRWSKLPYVHLTDATNLIRVLQQVQAGEIYSPIAQSHVQVSFEMPKYIANANGRVTCACSSRSGSSGWGRIRASTRPARRRHLIRWPSHCSPSGRRSHRHWPYGTALREFLHAATRPTRSYS